MTWYAYLKQNYTIRLDILRAKTKEEAIKEAFENYTDNYRSKWDDSLERVTLLEVNEEIEMGRLLVEEKCSRKAKQQLEEEESKKARREMYLKLKKEFED